MAWRPTWAVCLALGLQCMLSLGAAAYEFTVGGRRGWAVPTGNKTESFNEWAERNRFQVGDTLVFKYKQGQDLVLRVSAEDYQACNTAKPIESSSNGNTRFKFPRSGPFYFISGAAGNCQNGEKLVVVVMSPRNYSRSGGHILPAPSPAPSIASPPGIAPSHPIAAPASAPLVASPPSKAPSPSTVLPSPGPSPVSASAPFIASTPTPSIVPSPGPSTASPAPAPSIVSPTPASVASPASAPSTASPSPASLEAPTPASSNAPLIAPSTGTPTPAASSPVVAATPSAPPSAESTSPSAAAPIGFALALPLVMIIVNSLLN